MSQIQVGKLGELVTLLTVNLPGALKFYMSKQPGRALTNEVQHRSVVRARVGPKPFPLSVSYVSLDGDSALQTSVFILFTG